MNERISTARRARLGRALGQGLRGAYDHLGYVVLASFVSFLIVTAVLTSGMAAARVFDIKGIAAAALALPALLAGWLCAVGVFYYANRSVFHYQASLSDTWHGVRRLLAPALGLFIIDAVITTVLMGDLLLFRQMLAGIADQIAALQKVGGLTSAQELQIQSLGRTHLLLMAVTIVFGYITAAWGMIMMYHLPLLTAQLDMESGPRPKVILRKSVLLAVDNPVFTVALFLVIIAFAVLCALPAFIGMVVLFLGAIAFLLTHALRELFIKYEIVEEEPETVDDKPWHLPDSWMKRSS